MVCYQFLSAGETFYPNIILPDPLLPSQRLALVLGGEITSTFDTPENVRLGECKCIEEIMIGEDNLLKFSGVKLGEACTVVLRGATQQILDEADRLVGKQLPDTYISLFFTVTWLCK